MAARTTNGIAVAGIALACAACSVMADFGSPLVLPDLRDASEEVTFACEGDEDCSALGPCIVCESLVCVESPDADQDGDGYFNAACRGTVKGDDCDDGDALVHPDAEERCNGHDDNCNEVTDEGGAFGLSWTAVRDHALDPSAAPISGRTGLAWIEGTPPCGSVVSAFVDLGGAIRYPTSLSSCGEDVVLTERGASAGFAAAWVDWSLGGSDVFLELLDAQGDPVPGHEPVNVSDDYEESDMPALAWSPAGYHFAAAWLSHDTDDRKLVRVLLDIIESNGEPVLETHRQISSGYFELTGEITSGFGEQVSIVTASSDAFEGFGLAWAEPGGIWIATVEVTDDGTDIEAVMTHELPGTDRATFPSLTWTGDRFVVAYARPPSDSKPSPDVMLAEVLVEAGGLASSPIEMPYTFPREATYPAISYHEDLGELGLAWADGREGYGTRQVRFARLRLDETDPPSVDFVLDDVDLVLTGPGAYAGGVSLGSEPGGGFIATWVERDAEELGLHVGYLECKQ